MIHHWLIKVGNMSQFLPAKVRTLRRSNKKTIRINYISSLAFEFETN
jgi:hypothetical protein